MKRALFFVFALVIGLSTSPANFVKADSQASVVISELQTGGCVVGTEAACQEDGKQEFVELYNLLNEPVDVTGWRLEYLSQAHLGGSEPTRILASLNGSVTPGGFVLFSYENYLPSADAYFGAGSTAASGLLAKTAGHVRLVDSAGTLRDLVSWGSVSFKPDGYHRAPQIVPGQSIQRYLPGDPLFGQGVLFAPPSALTTPLGGGLQVVAEPEPEPPIQDDPAEEPNEPVPNPDEQTEPPAVLCDNLQISELLPNPNGNDSGKEFIEIHNPTNTTLPLIGCVLRLGDAGKQFALPSNEELAPGAYRAFYDSETKLVLPNAAGTTVWLLGITTEHGVSYPDALDADIAWAFNGAAWQTTNTATPGQVNAFTLPATAGKGAGKSELAPCGVGQERNPATNRCRAVTLAASTLAPCKPGQERNPATNRCRTIALAEDALKPCAEGQERNPETNRCRKVAGASTASIANVQDINSPGSGGLGVAAWWIAGVVVVAAASYGVYEWRHEITKGLNALKAKVLPARK